MEHNTRELIRRWMVDEGFRAESFQDVSSCLMEMQRSKPDVLLLDMLTGSIAGFDVVARVRESDETLPIVLLYHERMTEAALSAVKTGAFDFHPKPLERFRLCVSAKNAAERRTLAIENASLRRDLEQSVAENAPPSNGALSMRELEKQAICDALVVTSGNVSKAARVLGLGRTTLYRKMSSYGIDESRRLPSEKSPSSRNTAARDAAAAR